MICSNMFTNGRKVQLPGNGGGGGGLSLSDKSQNRSSDLFMQVKKKIKIKKKSILRYILIKSSSAAPPTETSHRGPLNFTQRNFAIFDGLAILAFEVDGWLSSARQKFLPSVSFNFCRIFLNAISTLLLDSKVLALIKES